MHYSSLVMNKAQMQAVTAPEGHLLINAAAGTGKTSTVAARMVWLQSEKGIKPYEMLAISFSRNARNQITEKIERLCFEMGQGSAVRTYTFHGLSYRILRLAAELGETWLRPGFSVMTEGAGNGNTIFCDYYDRIFKGIEDEYDNYVKVQVYSKAVDLARQGHPQLGCAIMQPEDVPGGRYITIPGDFSAKIRVRAEHISVVWKRYQRLLIQKNMIDYPGLVNEAVMVLMHGEGRTAKRILDGLRYIIVDEYQDTSRAQETLLLKLAGEKVYINAVGDNDQAIYTFNGSDVSNILEFEERVSFTGLPVLSPVTLTENYRYAPNILALANRVLKNSDSFTEKKLEAAKERLPDPVETYRDRNFEVSLVYAPRLELGAEFVAGECCRLIQNEGVEPKDIVILVRKNTEVSPQGDTVKNKLLECGVNAEVNCSDPARAAADELIWELCQNNYGNSIMDILDRLDAGYFDRELGAVKREDVQVILRETQSAGATYAYEAIDLLFDSDENYLIQADPETIQVRTVHSAKGAEFRIVFLLYLADRQFPHGMMPDVSEERRLFYVGITRAQERLYIVGKNGVHGPDFFGDCEGLGVKKVSYTVPGGTEYIGHNSLKNERLDEIERARKQQAGEEARRLAEIRKMLEEENGF